MGTLAIKEVDLAALEKQRRHINTVDWWRLHQDGVISTPQFDAITSVEGMLDAWSDKIWEKQNVDT